MVGRRETGEEGHLVEGEEEVWMCSTRVDKVYLSDISLLGFRGFPLDASIQQPFPVFTHQVALMGLME